MIASTAILHLAHNGDISLTTAGLIDAICIVLLLILISLGVWLK